MTYRTRAHGIIVFLVGIHRYMSVGEDFTQSSKVGKLLKESLYLDQTDIQLNFQV